MSILINIPGRPLDKLIAKLSQSIAVEDIEVWPNIKSPEDIEFALVWKHQTGSLTGLPNLKAISSFGAGVDSILQDTALPTVPIARIVDDNLAVDMAEYVYAMVQHHRLRLGQFNQQQEHSHWKPKSARKGKRVGVLGAGQLGMAVARLLKQRGFNVQTWSRSEKPNTDIPHLTGQNGFDELVSQSDFLICLLPLTTATENILNHSVFELMPSDAALINVARGQHLVDDDLITALDNYQLSFAYLDVFRQEPLPSEHKFWQHQKIQITPHISAVTNVDTAVAQVIENYQRVKAGKPIKNSINLAFGY